MNKDIKRIIVFVLCSFLLMGCKKIEKASETEKNTTSMFVEIERTELCIVVYHKKTKVMYAVSLGAYNCGDFTLLVNADGSPMIYELEEDKEK